MPAAASPPTPVRRHREPFGRRLRRFCQQGSNAGKPGVCPTATPSAPAAKPQGRLARVASAAGKAEHAITSEVKRRVEALPRPVRVRVKAVWGLLTAPYAAAWDTVAAVAHEAGVKPEHAKVATSILATMDAVWAKTPLLYNQASSLTHSLTGFDAGEIPEAAAFVPVFSLAATALLSVARPLRALRAAHRLLFNAKANLRQATGHAEGEAYTPDDVKQLLRSLGEHETPWYAVLVFAALDHTQGDLKQALQRADAAIGEEPEMPGDATPHAERFSESATIRGAEIFSTGSHRGKEYTEADLDSMVENFRRFSAGAKPKLRVPGVIGHEEEQEYLERSDLPAAAWTTGLSKSKPQTCEDCKGAAKNAEGEPCTACAGTGKVTKLLADFGDVPPKVARLLKGKAYRTVSSEVYDEPPEGLTGGRGKMLRRVAFLGGEIPQIKNLEDIPTPELHAEAGASYRPVYLKFSEARARPAAGTFFVFAEVVPMDRDKMIEELGGLGFNAEILSKMDDQELSEILRVYGQEEEGEGDAPPPEGDGNADGTFDEDPPEEMPADEEERKKLEAHAERLGARARKWAEKTGIKTRRFGEDEPLPEPKDDDEKKNLRDYAERVVAHARKFCGDDTVGRMSDDDATHTAADEINPSQVGQPMPKKVTTTHQYSEQRLEAMIERVLEKKVNGSLGRLSKFAETTEANQKKQAVESFCEAQRKAGKLTPAELDQDDPANVFDRLLRADATHVVRKFREGKKEVALTEFDLAKREIERRRPFTFAERVKTGKTAVTADSDDEVGKVQRFAESDASFSSALTAAGKTPAQYAAEFAAAKKKNPALTAKQYGVPETAAA